MSHAVHGRSRSGARGGTRSLLILPFVIFSCVTFIAVSYVAYVLWPRWPGPPVAPDAPSLPVVIGNVTFNVPPAAIRRPAQRRPGTQERLDLAFLWPSLIPPPAAAESGSDDASTPKPLERIFVTIAAGAGALSPLERMKTVYTRYLASDPVAGPNGLVTVAFRAETPYQGEDLLYAAEAPERFFLRCSKRAGPTPGTCLHERRIGEADVTVRFPRDWLDDWRAMASGIDRLIIKLQSPAG